MNQNKEYKWTWLRCYFSSLLFYGVSLILFFNLNYYNRALNDFSRQAMLTLYGAYVVFSPIYYILNATHVKENHTFRVLRYAFDVCVGLMHGTFRPLKQDEKVSLFFLMVKFFFLPIMLSFVGNHFSYFERDHSSYRATHNGRPLSRHAFPLRAIPSSAPQCNTREIK